MALSLERVIRNEDNKECRDENLLEDTFVPLLAKRRPWQAGGHSDINSTSPMRKEKYLLDFFKGVDVDTTKEFLFELIH